MAVWVANSRTSRLEPVPEELMKPDRYEALSSAAFDDTSIDGFHNNAFRVVQPTSGAHRAGLDALLLAASVSPEAKGRIADLGAGCGVVGMAVAQRCSGVDVDLMEIDPAAVAMTIRSLELPENDHLKERMRVHAVDLTQSGRARSPVFEESAYDHIISNPPYNNFRHQQSTNSDRRRAHVAEEGLLEAWLNTASFLVRPKGTLSLIIRTDILHEVLRAIDGRFGATTILPVHSKASAPAKRVILTARKGVKSPMQILPGFVVHRDDGPFTDHAERIFRGIDWLRLK